MLEKVRHLMEQDEGKEFKIPEKCVFLSDVCYENGEPVIISPDKPILIKVGKHRFIRVKLVPDE